MQTLPKTLLALKTAVTKADKIAILNDHRADNDLTTALQYLFNPYWFSGATTLALKQTTESTPGLTTFIDVWHLLKMHRQLSIPNVQQINGYRHQFGGEDRGIIDALLTKTLALGLGAKTLRDVWPDLAFPDFKVQLAYPVAKKMANLSDTTPLYVTQKLDGHRAATFVEFNGPDINVITFTRMGQVIDGLNEYHDDVKRFVMANSWLKTTFKDGFVLDGELLLQNVNHVSTVELFQLTSNVLRRVGNKSNLVHHVFEIVPLDEFMHQWESNKDYAYRRTHWLDKCVDTKCIHIVPLLAVIDKSEIHQWSNYAIDRGWEGVMLNVGVGHYRRNRTPNLLKVKKMHTADLPIVGITKDDNGYLQTIDVKLSDDVIVGVGSGLTDELRQTIIQHPDHYIGMMMEVQFFEIMKNKDGQDDLRFPVFKTFRMDKTPEDINVE